MGKHPQQHDGPERRGGKASLRAARLWACAGGWTGLVGPGGLVGMAGVLCVSPLVSVAHGQVAAPGENPTFVNDSPVAGETLLRIGDHIGTGNHDQAVKLMVQLLGTDAHSLVVSPEDPGLFLPVRTRIHRLLLSEPLLLAKYREVAGPGAAELLRQERIEQVERTALLTPAGFEAALRLTQQLIESASFDAAMLVLAQLENHPDRTGAGAADAAALARQLARYLTRPEVRALAERWSAGGAGGAGGGAAEIGRPVTPPASVSERARSGFEAGPKTAVNDVVAGALSSVTFGDETPLETTRAGGGTVNELPPLGRELRTFPTLHGGAIFVAGPAEVVALDRATLNVRWRTDVLRQLNLNHPSNERADRDVANELRFGPIRRQTSSGAEDVSTVAVAHGGRVLITTVTAGDQQRSGIDGTQWLVGLDGATGALRWVQPVEQLDPQFGTGTSVRGPVLIDGDTAVLCCRKFQPERRLSALYLAGVDVLTGKPNWVSLVGSAGSLPYFRGPSVSDGGVIDAGVVYRPDKIGVVAAYQAVGGRPVWVRRLSAEPLDNSQMQSLSPWQMQLPVLNDGWLYVVTPDRKFVRRFEMGTGRAGAAMSAELLGSPQYLLSCGDRLAAVGTTRISFVPFTEFGGQEAVRAAPGVSATPSFDLPGFRGRVGEIGDLLVVPLAKELALIDPRSPEKIVSAVTLDNPGNVLAVDGTLVVADDARVYSYFGWSQADRTLTRRIEQSPTDPTPGVMLTDMALRSGHHDRLAFAIDSAARALQPDSAVLPQAIADRNEIERAKLVGHLTSAVEAAQGVGARTGGAKSPLDGSVQTMLVGKLGTLVHKPEERAAHRLLLGADFVRLDQPRQALEAYQGVLADAEMAGATWRTERSSYDARAEATRRVQDVVKTAGRDSYSKFDAEAEAAMAALGPTPDAVAMEGLAQRYPAARSAPAWWSRIADTYKASGRLRAEARGLELGLMAAERIPDPDGAVVGELAGRLVVNLRQRGLLEAAADTLRTVRARRPEVALTVGGKPIDQQQLAADLGEHLAAERRWPRVGAPVAAGATVLQGWAILDPMVPPTRGISPGCIALRHEDNRVALYGAPTDDGPMVELWAQNKAAAGEGAELLKIDRNAAYFVHRSGGVAIERVGLTRDEKTGQLTAASDWRTKGFRSYFGANEPVRPATRRTRQGVPDAGLQRGQAASNGFTSPDGFKQYDEMLVSADDRTVVMVERTGKVVALDADSGTVLWSTGTSMQRVFDARVVAGVLVLAGQRDRVGNGGAVLTTDEMLLVLDARSGQPVRELVAPAGAGMVRWVRLTERGDLIAGLQSQVVCYDLETGDPAWSITQHPASSSADAWLVGPHLLLLGDDREHSLWMSPGATGQVLAEPLKTRSRLETSGPAHIALTSPASKAGAEAGSLIAIRSPQGIVLLNERGELVGADSIGAQDNLVPPVPCEGGFVAVSTVPGQTRDENNQVFGVYFVDDTSALVRSMTPIALPLAPQRVAVLDGRLAVTTGHSTVVYRAPR